jgi:hypothetical protein
LGCVTGLEDFLELLGRLRGNGFRLGGVSPMKMHCEIAEVCGYVGRIHDLGFSVGRFTWLHAQAEAPGVGL